MTLIDPKENLNIVSLFLENIADKNPNNRFQQTPLHIAALHGKFDVFKLIFEKVSDKNIVLQFSVRIIRFSMNMFD